MFNRSKAWAASLLGATFILGAAVGGVALAAWGDVDDEPERRPRGRTSFVDRLDRDLQLTPAQRESVVVILERRQAAMRELWREMGPRFDSLRAQINDEITGVLDQHQQEVYRQLIARGDSARRARDRRGSHER